MAFTVPATLPAAPPYGLPPNVIRASYALNLIQTDAFQFATSRRKVCNLFQISPLPAGSEVTVAEFLYYPLPTATGSLEIVLYGADVDVKLESLTSALSTVTTATTDNVYTNQLTGLTSAVQIMQIKVTDLGSGYIVGLFVFESALSAGSLP
jgi:hypothetical protein